MMASLFFSHRRGKWLAFIVLSCSGTVAAGTAVDGPGSRSVMFADVCWQGARGGADRAETAGFQIRVSYYCG